ncbi:MAG: hypothetical protein RL404_683 [Pseudomonadota bacterium]
MKIPIRSGAGRRCMAALLLVGGVAALSLALAHGGASDSGSSDEDEPAPIQSLKRVKVPTPKNLGDFVEDRDTAILLGKALFWDVKLGSDSMTACASCHFHAGVDNRVTNQINPGLLAGDKTFQLGGAPNYMMLPADFPLTRFTDINDPATRYADINDVVSSQGVLTKDFNTTGLKGAADACTPVSDAVMHGGTGFNVNGVNTRRVEPRHAPSFFNSIFNFRNFWDGRANNVFNGVDPFGLRNVDATVWKLDHGVLRRVPVVIDLASDASQGVGPPSSENEMSCKGRTLAQVGRRMLKLEVLSVQEIHPDDSVLGRIAHRRGTYEQLVKRAFKSIYWSSDRRIDLQQSPRLATIDLAGARSASNPRPVSRETFSQMEANFGFFLGLALRAYQATLVTDDTPFDRFAEGQRNALTAQQQRGLALFRGRANCVHCHAGAEFTAASFASMQDEGRLDEREGEGGQIFRYDNGFFNTGVRPTADDPGVSGLDPFGNTLSETRLAQIGRFDLLGPLFDIRNEEPVAPDAPLAIAGAFKTPGLRNVELTGPYFHNGGKVTLMQVVDFYNRGGDFGAHNAPVTDPTVTRLGLTESDKQDLVSFLLALTDERVRFERAPFDHPSICVPDGHLGNTNVVATGANGDAIDLIRCVNAVGRRGSRVALRPFMGLDPFLH